MSASAPPLSPVTEQPLGDLELWRRTANKYPPDRSVAEMWRLLGRHRKEAELYEYAAWYFARERRYDELSLLLKNAALQEQKSPALDYWNVFQAARAAGPVDGVELLLAASGAKRPWFTEANIGRFYEAGRSYAAAERHYYYALVNADTGRDKARILDRISRCLTAQGKTVEARAVLEEALAFDPENLTVRSALNNLYQ